MIVSLLDSVLEDFGFGAMGGGSFLGGGGSFLGGEGSFLGGEAEIRLERQHRINQYDLVMNMMNRSILYIYLSHNLSLGCGFGDKQMILWQSVVRYKLYFKSIASQGKLYYNNNYLWSNTLYGNVTVFTSTFTTYQPVQNNYTCPTTFILLHSKKKIK